MQDVDNDEKLTFTLSDVQAKCSCSYGEVDCQDYGSRNESGKLGNSDEVKIRTDNTKNYGVDEKPAEFAGTSFSFVIKSKSKKKMIRMGFPLISLLRPVANRMNVISTDRINAKNYHY